MPSKLRRFVGGGQPHHLWYIAPSVPSPNKSSRFAAQLAPPMSVSKTPPRLSQPPQRLPSHHLWCIALSVPRAKQSSRFVLQASAVTLSTMMPPRLSQPPHWLPFHHLWYIAL